MKGSNQRFHTPEMSDIKPTSPMLSLQAYSADLFQLEERFLLEEGKMKRMMGEMRERAQDLEGLGKDIRSLKIKIYAALESYIESECFFYCKRRTLLTYNVLKPNLGPPKAGQDEGEGSVMDNRTVAGKDEGEGSIMDNRTVAGKVFQCHFRAGLLIGCEGVVRRVKKYRYRMPTYHSDGEDLCGCESSYGVDDDSGEVRHINCPYDSDE